MSGSKRNAQGRTVEGELLPRTPPKIRLSDLESVRREMASVYRDMRGGKIDTQDGSRLVYSLGQIGKLIEVASLERRIDELERLAAGEQSGLLEYEEDEDE
ncbi:MAG: hypothetical protein WBZ31_10425 [Thiobacillus sp.]